MPSNMNIRMRPMAQLDGYGYQHLISLDKPRNIVIIR